MSAANFTPKKKLFEKQFKIRVSPLTDRFENNQDIKTIYNLFAIILISLLTNTIIHDYTKTGRFHFGFRLIIACFNNPHVVVFVWFCQISLAYCVYWCFMSWAKTRLLFQPKAAKVWDKLWLIITTVYYLSSLYTIQQVVKIFNLAPGSATVLFLEEIRLLMKQHAFIRTNAPQILNYKPHTDQQIHLPSIYQFRYFLFAPTLIYRNEYPRTDRIRWKFVFYNIGEILSIIWLLSLIIERFLIPHFEDICLRKFSLSEILVPVIGNSFPGILFLLCGFYSVLHSAQNAMAEVLRFGDRMFYKEWWTCTSLTEYFRTWNVVVYDWLFTYIYRDFYEHIVPKNKIVAKLAVFVISAIVHEWILINVLKVFFPIQFIQFFLVGALFNSLDLSLGNFVVWYLIIFGSGMQVNLYTIEMFAYKNCPLEQNITIYNFFKPRFVTCDCIQ